MEYLWENGPQRPGDLHAALSSVDGVAYTTIHTELTRLVKKGFLRKSTRGDPRYAVVLSRENFTHAAVQSVLLGLMESHRAAAIHGFADLVSGDELAREELERALKERRRR
ncbi:MAG: BlaI/MecI/CopY family transcriptional regulator [Candidatus Eremiobacteraeota bacterium]|nr:BlaI/MecI/CopY family transcriptional regulator [Candidatus Eremiobacteraeota bacterium]